VTNSQQAVRLLRELVDGQQRQLVELTRIRLALERHGPSLNVLEKRDRERLAVLLPAIGAVLEEFQTKDLREYPTIAVVRGSLNDRQLGKLLGRAVGHVCDGWLVERLGRQGNTVIWRVSSLVSRVLTGVTSPNQAA